MSKKIGRSARARLKEHQREKLRYRLELAERKRLKPKPIKVAARKPPIGGDKISFPIQPNEISGLCACGCGKNTSMILGGDSKNGYWCQGYRRFVSGHQWTLRNRLLGRPKDFVSSFALSNERYALGVKIAKTVSILTVPTFQNLRNSLGEIKLAGRDVPNSSIGVMLRKRWSFDKPIPVLIAARISKPASPPITEFYPYGAAGSDDLVAYVYSLIPPYMGDYARAEVCQEIFLSIFSGNLKREQVKSQLPNYIKDYYGKFGRWDQISFNESPERGGLEGVLLEEPQREYSAFNKTPDRLCMEHEEWEERNQRDRFMRQKYGKRLTYSMETAFADLKAMPVS